MNTTKALESESIGKLINRFYWPAFISVFVNALYNIVDRIFIGQGVGSSALSGLSIIFPIILIMAAFGMLFGIGTGVQISIRLGKKDKEGAEKTLANGFLMMFLVAIFITLLGFAIKKPLLLAFGATQETYQYAQDYLNIILMGTIFQVLGFSLNNVIRSEGNARIAMVSMLISAIANMILDPIFIFTLDMGVEGAAWATVISMMLMCFWVLHHFLRKRSVVHLNFKKLKPDWKIIGAIVAVGMAPFSMQLASSGVQAVLNVQLIKFGGDVAVAASGIIMSIMNMIFMCIIAVTMATQPIIGYNYGAKKFTRVKEALIKGMKIASFISFGGFLLVQLFPELLIKAFNTNDEELVRIGVRGTRIGLAMLFLVGFQVVVGNYFQSTGKAATAMLISLLRQVIVLTPAMLILPAFFGLDGVWMSMPVSGFISSIIVSIYLKREWGILNKSIANSSS